MRGVNFILALVFAIVVTLFFFTVSLEGVVCLIGMIAATVFVATAVASIVKFTLDPASENIAAVACGVFCGITITPESFFCDNWFAGSGRVLVGVLLTFFGAALFGSWRSLDLAIGRGLVTVGGYASATVLVVLIAVLNTPEIVKSAFLLPGELMKALIGFAGFSCVTNGVDTCS